LQKKIKNQNSLSKEAFLERDDFFVLIFLQKKSKQKNHLSLPPLSGEKLTYFFTAHLLTHMIFPF
jgi:hypothetical protein